MELLSKCERYAFCIAEEMEKWEGKAKCLSSAKQINEVLSAVHVKTTVFWSVTPCGLARNLPVKKICLSIYSKICLQRNRKGLNIFRFRKVPLHTGT